MSSCLAGPCCFKAYGLYEGDIKRVTRGVLADLGSVIHAALVGTVLLWLYTRVTPLPAVEADALVISVFALALSVSVLRIAARRALRRLLGAERVVIVGDSASIPLLARKLRAHPEYGMELVGAVGDPDAAGTADLPVLADPGALDLRRLAAQHRLDRIIFAGSQEIEGTLADLVRSAHRIELKVDYLPHPLDVLGAGVEVDDIEGVTVFSLYPPVLPRSSRVVKRIMDIGGALVALVLAAPVMLARRRRREAGRRRPRPLPAPACGSRRPPVLGAQVPHDGGGCRSAARTSPRPEPRSALAVTR